MITRRWQRNKNKRHPVRKKRELKIPFLPDEVDKTQDVTDNDAFWGKSAENGGVDVNFDGAMDAVDAWAVQREALQGA